MVFHDTSNFTLRGERMLNVMIVDDEERIRTGLKKIIEKAKGNQVKINCFEDGHKAINYLIDHQDIDVLITDIRMPILNGLELIKKINNKYPNLVKIIISGYEDFEYARQAIKFGVTDYLLKPIDKKELITILSTINKNDKIPSSSINNQKAQGHWIIEQVKENINRNYKKTLSLKSIADEVYLNPSYLSKLFKDTEGMTITDYLIHLRMEKAKHLLEIYPELKIFEVGEMVGYPDPIYFNKVFRKNNGLTPKEYKERNQ